jgi:hypothetical protein
LEMHAVGVIGSDDKQCAVEPRHLRRGRKKSRKAQST